MALISPHARRSPWADAWCARCARASRVGQWVPGGDRCPHCGADASRRLAWALLRLSHPDWPLHPVIGETYGPAG